MLTRSCYFLGLIHFLCQYKKKILVFSNFAIKTDSSVFLQTVSIKKTVGGNSYEEVKTLKYLGSLFTNQNSIQKEIKCRLKAGNSCYYSVQTLLDLSNNLKIKIYKTVIFPVVLYGCEAWSLNIKRGMPTKGI